MNEKTKSCVTVSILYRDAPAAIAWLCRVFGFEKHAVYPGPDNTILHSELTLGGGMIMPASLGDGRRTDSTSSSRTRSTAQRR
jgi:uncharacterized glyoxalase superfamily protein PhnB